jgi:hypothetical protein
MKVRGVFPVGIILILLLAVSSSFAQQYEDVVYLKDGGVRRGLILEQIPGESVKLKTNYGEIFVISMSDISKIAKEEKTPPVAESVAVIDNAPREMAENQQEDWYTYWGLGISKVTWPEELNDGIKLIAAMPGVSRTQLNLDLLGFYKPINPNTIVGFIANGAADRLEIEGEWVQVNLYTYAASAQYFPEEIGKGMFGRVDIGPAFGTVEASGEESESSDPGFGLLVGVGYAHPITDGTRLALNVNYAIRQIEGDSWKTLGISLGGLF